ncbi:MAG: winged helix-turn-helix transcriptional regulator [Chloroflexota bacterium]
MTTREERKQRAELLKRVREERTNTVQATQSHLKEQQAIRKQLQEIMREGPATVPDLASATDLSTQTVLWHVTAMKKYDLVKEVSFDGEYYQYALAEGPNS